VTRLAYFHRRLAMTVTHAGLRWRRLRALAEREPTARGLPDLLFAALDLLGFFDLYEAFTNALFPAPRPLSAAERRLLQPIFGNSVPYDLIRVDERAYVGPRFAPFCYVSFHTVNSWGKMSAPTLVHEIVHVWQYTHRGAAYIPRALYAQTTAAGYNYGGLEPLRRHHRLEDFNYEQQADIIEDAFRLANGWPGQWIKGAGAEVLGAYYPYLDEIREKQLIP